MTGGIVGASCGDGSVVVLMAALLAPLAAGPATDRHRPEMAFCFLVVPLLLFRGPGLRRAAVEADKRVIPVPAGQIAVGVDLGELAGIRKHGTRRWWFAGHVRGEQG